MSLQFRDYRPSTEDFYSAIIDGLSKEPKQLSPKWFYDETGSRLFDEICHQPEYYIPDAEREIFETYAEEIIECLGEDCLIIEPGAGSSEKIRFFLNRMKPAMYLPMDISADYLQSSAERLSDEYRELDIYALCLDHTKPYELPKSIPTENRVFFYPGSSLGNLDKPDALKFLYDMRLKAGKQGGLLIGIDTKKHKSILDNAYNDAAGITASFNLNILKRIQHELDTNLEPDTFQHTAFYNESAGRIEMHLSSSVKQQISISDHDFVFNGGETIHTESSYKYSTQEFIQIASQTGWRSNKVWSDTKNLFSVHYFTSY